MDFQSILDSKLAVAGISAIGGGLATRFLERLKNRIQELEYKVTHDRVGFSVDDPIFGSVKAIWNGTELSNLYNSTVTISNSTTKDLKEVVVKVYTGSTRLLSQSVSIKDTTYVPPYTDSYKEALQVSPGEQATQVQLNQYFTSREYKIAALNRGQVVVLQYLTHEPNQASSPAVWVEIQQEGLRAVFKKTVPEVHGVPMRYAVAAGLLASIGILIGAVYLNLPTWLAALVAMLGGWFATSIGAWMYRLVKGLIRFLSS